jgi:hypothetical protein
MKVLIAVPTYDTVNPETFKSIYGLDRGNHEYMFDFVKGYGCQVARDKLIREAIEYSFDFIMYVDSDVILPSNSIVELIKLGVPLATGWHIKNRSTTGLTELYMSNFNNGYTNIDSRQIENYLRLGKTIIDIDGCGFGCALVDVRMVKDIYNNKWFEYIEYEDGNVLSEDMNFSNHIRKSGHPIKANLNIRCGHISKVIL